MARLFRSANSSYLEVLSSPISAMPFSFGCWVYPLQNTLLQDIFTIGDVGEGNDYYNIALNGADAGDPINLYCRDATSGTQGAPTTTGYSINKWHHATFVATSSTLKEIYIDGGSKGTETVSVTPSTIEIRLGSGEGATPVNYSDCRLADAFIYNAALTDAEVKLLAMGLSPLLVRRQNLVFYAPLTYRSQDFDIVGNLSLTAYNSPSWAEHPSGLIYPEPMPAMIGEQTPLFWVEPITEEEAGETLSIAVTPSDTQFWKTGVKIVG